MHCIFMIEMVGETSNELHHIAISIIKSTILQEIWSVYEKMVEDLSNA